MTSGDSLWWFLILVPTGLVLLLYVLPILNILAIAFTQPDKGFENAALGNFSVLFTEPAIARMILRTARICIVTTVITVILGYAVAYAMSQVGATHRSLMMFCIMTAFWMSVLVRAFSWLVLLKNGGLLHTVVNYFYLTATGGDQHSMITLSRTEFSVLVGMIHFMLPLAILPMYVSTSSVDFRTIQASRCLGANSWQTFWLVFFVDFHEELTRDFH